MTGPMHDWSKTLLRVTNLPWGRLSHDCAFNRPVERVFDESPSEFFSWLDLGVEQLDSDKCATLEEMGWDLSQDEYSAAAVKWTSSSATRYVNYLFHELG